VPLNDSTPEDLSMMTCTPESWFTWNYRVSGAEAGGGRVTFHWFTEQGTIELGIARYTVRKHGPLSGRWTLKDVGRVLAEAHKPNPFSRYFEIQIDGGPGIVAEARAMYANSYNITRDGEVIGAITRTSFWTSRSEIACSADVPEPVQLFAFWLAALTWKRQAKENQSSQAGSSGGV
jgi:hypothetical protein